VNAALRPYAAAFAARFQLMLQYRAAALAGFATQCWWGATKVMIYAAFYGAAVASDAPLSLSQTITYTWLAQGLLALSPWSADPEIGLAARSGAVGYDRLRPIDTYGWWYARAAAWLIARAAPRLGLMLLFAAVALPLAGLGEWSCRPPASAAAAALFAVSLALGVALSASVLVLLNIVAVVTLDDRGVNALIAALIVAFSGNLVPIALYPDALQPFLLLQPFAGLLDIPLRIYTGALVGTNALTGLGVQAFWALALMLVGRRALARTMTRLQMQGG
jgi:ABC-2 type transport system permease protein